MERMLIQAQCQKDREKKCKIRANDVEIRNEQNTATASETATAENAVDDTDVEMTEISEMADAKAESKMDTESKLPKPTTDEAENTTNTPSTSASEISPKTEEKASPKESEPQEAIEQQSATDNSSEPIKIEESVQEIDPANIINIDPRTYCKLGHFHLLLEDYPKGELIARIFFPQEYSMWCTYIV